MAVSVHNHFNDEVNTSKQIRRERAFPLQKLIESSYTYCLHLLYSPAIICDPAVCSIVTQHD